VAPAVALIDDSSGAFGEGVCFSYFVNGAMLKLSAHGAVGIGWGAKVRTSGESSWGTGTLREQESVAHLVDGQSASVVFYGVVPRSIIRRI